MAEQELNIGVDVGGTNIKVGLLNGRGSILAQKRVATQPHLGPDAVIRILAETIDAVLLQHGTSCNMLTSMGIGVPGTADAETGTVVYAPNIFWKDVGISRQIQSRFNVPVYVAQDTRAAAWAEYLVGEAQGMRSLASVTLGTGIGCGMVFDGKIFHGAMNTAGEFGHQIVEFEGQACNCGRRGCLEAHAGGLAIVRAGRKRIPQLQQLLQKDVMELTVDDVYRLSAQGHPQARKLTEDVVRYVGIGLVNLINLNSIEVVCLSGGISNAPAALLLDPLIAFVQAHAYDMIAKRVRVCRSLLGDDAPLIGASLLYRTLTQAACAA